MTLLKPRRLRTKGALLAVCTAALFAAPQAAQAGQPPPGCTDFGAPLLHAHSHNDYQEPVPLCDALSHGFTSVEADVWLIDGRLLVGHTEEEARTGMTLQDEYLDPLRDIVAARGAVYPGMQQPFQLVIELKGQDPNPTLDCFDQTGTKQSPPNIALWEAVHNALFPMWNAGYLSTYDHGVVQERALKVVYSGNTPRACVAGVDPRPEFFDGSLDDPYTPAQMPIINASWKKSGLIEFVDDAHAQGYKVRFWFANPDDDTESNWIYELAFGVDYIGSDHIADLDATLRPYDAAYGYVTVDGAGAAISNGPNLLQGFLYDTTPRDTNCADVTLTPGPGNSTPYTYRTCDENEVYWLEFTDSSNTYVDVTVSTDNGNSTTQRFEVPTS